MNVAVKQSAAAFDRGAYMILLREVEDFLYFEADVLDSRDWLRWLDFFTEDLRYWMPIRKNLAFRDRDRDITTEDEAAWFDNNKDLLTRRVKQLMTGIHWAEEPLSRISHLVTNVRLETPVDRLDDGEELAVWSKFLLYRNRLETETDILVGRRYDRLRRSDGDLQICYRKVLLDQNVLTVKNLSFFF
jgi:3-phenylpropionate/cinnamic acid dioxygenase small subunit